MLRIAQLKKYHSLITDLINDMNQLCETLNYPSESNSIMTKDMYYSYLHVFEDFNMMIYDHIVNRVYRHSPFDPVEVMNKPDPEEKD